MLAIWEDFGLKRQVRTAGVHQVQTGQAVVDRHLLRAKVLLDRERVVGAALHRRIVGDDEHLALRYPADAGHQPCAGRVVVVDAVRRQRRQLEERRAAIEQLLETFADQEFPLVPMAADGALVAAFAHSLQPGAEVGDQPLHVGAIGTEFSRSGFDVSREGLHRLVADYRTGPESKLNSLNSLHMS